MQDIKKKITIEIEESSTLAKIKVPTDIGTFVTKLITIDNLTELLEESKYNLNIINKKNVKKKNIIDYETEIFPSNGDVSLIKYLKFNNEKRMIVIKKKAYRHDFAYGKNIYSDVGIPTLLFFLPLNKQDMIYQARVFAVKDEAIRKTTKLYHYPFTNVSDEGVICFGSNMNALVVKDFNSLAFFTDKFLMMPSTHEGKHNKLDISAKELIEVLSGMDFEDEFLVKTRYTFGDVLEKLKSII